MVTVGLCSAAGGLRGSEGRGIARAVVLYMSECVLLGPFFPLRCAVLGRHRFRRGRRLQPFLGKFARENHSQLRVAPPIQGKAR